MNSDYQRIESAINYLRKNAAKQPGLDELARACGLSPYHFQRLFRRWAGISPKQFLKYLTVQHARQMLASSAAMLDTCFEVGLSGPGRLHDHFVTIEAVTPGDVKSKGSGLQIICGTIDSPFGRAFIAMTGRGICALEFIGDEKVSSAVERLAACWPYAEIEHDDSAVARRADGLFDRSGTSKETKLLVQGTNLQIQVWQALLNIPAGHLCAYGQLAKYLGRPDAARAVASAIGANRIAYLIPCHRVLRSAGELGGYRWGLARKQAMLAKEFSQAGNKNRVANTDLAVPA